MSISRYDKGDLVRLSAAFADSGGAAVDPTTVALKYRAPGADLVTLTYGADDELVRDSAGHYHADVSADIAGRWRYRWESTGTGQAAAGGEFHVEPGLS